MGRIRRRLPLRGRAGETLAALVLLLVAVIAAALSWTSASPADEGAAPPGDQVVFRDDFDRDELGNAWGAYSGQPGGDPHSWWEPDQVSLRDGNLVLRADQRDGQWITGGVSNASHAQTYGSWTVRFRADAADDITVHFLLWPLSESWPPEIDFFENFGGDRNGGSAFLHWTEGDERRQLEKHLNGIDFTQWHTVGVEWREGRIDYLVDGRVWASVSGDNVPDEPMWLGLQAQAGGCARSAEYGNDFCPAVGTPDGAEIEIDWVEVRS